MSAQVSKSTAENQADVLAKIPNKNNRQVLAPLRTSKRPISRRDKEMQQANQILRKNQPYLSIQETTAYRYSFKHNLCLDMLQAGYHHSFHELFVLLRQQAKEREEAGPDSVIWNEPQLQHQNMKLEKLRDQLTRAEAALRNGETTEQYNARHELALYFMTTGDAWLAEHFFKTCLEISLHDCGDNAPQLQAEGHQSVGLRYQELGNHLQAAYHFEEAYKLTKEHQDWLNRHGTKMHADTCIDLCSIYATIGSNISKKDLQEAVEYFQKSYNMAKESNDRKRIAESGYRLGLAYNKIDDTEMSLKYLRGFLDQCQRQQDIPGIGRACDAISSLYREQGNIDKCVEYLRIFSGVAEHSKNEEAYSKACQNLGSIYNYMGQYNEATDNFGKAYNLSRSVNDHSSINVNRVLFGVSMAHSMLGKCCHHVSSRLPANVAVVSNWKSARTDEFSEPTMERVTPETNSNTTVVGAAIMEHEEIEENEEVEPSDEEHTEQVSQEQVSSTDPLHQESYNDMTDPTVESEGKSD